MKIKQIIFVQFYRNFHVWVRNKVYSSLRTGQLRLCGKQESRVISPKKKFSFLNRTQIVFTLKYFRMCEGEGRYKNVILFHLEAKR